MKLEQVLVFMMFLKLPSVMFKSVYGNVIITSIQRYFRKAVICNIAMQRILLGVFLCSILFTFLLAQKLATCYQMSNNHII